MKSGKSANPNKKTIILIVIVLLPICLFILHFGYSQIKRHNTEIIFQPDLRVKVSSTHKVKAGQKVNYVIEYRNDGLKNATEAIVYFYLDPVIVYKSASSGAYYDPYAHQVSWNLGALRAKSSGKFTVQAEIPNGLPAHLKLDNRAYILDINLKDKENKQ